LRRKNSHKTTLEVISSPSPSTKNEHVWFKTWPVRNEKFCPKKPVRNDTGRKIVACSLTLASEAAPGATVPAARPGMRPARLTCF
jgi:hypothetical protein